MAPLPEISAPVLARTAEYQQVFQHAKPFKHVVIEDFFEPSFAGQLLAEFPSFDPNLARNETGLVGGKAVHTAIRQISPAYQRLYDTLAGKPFLDFVSRLAGIPDLLLDPQMFGGGTHENLHGQELDAHVDFNYDQPQQLHRRLNLIVYLNQEWRPEWGGAIEIHSNPRKPFENQIHSYDPLFNRCVMFETNEYSWHGFPKIDLPEDRRHLSRKSISIYLYTKDRPAEEVVPVHGTFYVQRPLPKHLLPGYTLTEKDHADLIRLLVRRDGWIEYYQNMEMRKNGEIAEMSHHIRRLRVEARAPLTGYIVQEDGVEGFFRDGWAASRMRLPIRPLMPVSQLMLSGFRPHAAPAGKIQVFVNGALSGKGPVTGSFETLISMPKDVRDVFQLEVIFESPQKWITSNGDDRDLAFVLTELRARHPGCQGP